MALKISREYEWKPRQLERRQARLLATLVELWDLDVSSSTSAS